MYSTTEPVNGDYLMYSITEVSLTHSVPNFRRHLSSAFFILTNHRLERRLYVKLVD